MKYVILFLSVTLSAFTCVKSDTPTPPPDAETWLLSTIKMNQVEGAPQGAQINGQYITRVEDSILYDAQYNAIGRRTLSYGGNILLQTLEQVCVIEGENLFFLNNGARVAAGIIDLQTKSLLRQPLVVNTSQQSNGMIDTVIATEQFNEYDAGNYRTKDSLHTLRARRYQSFGRWVRHRQDDYRTFNFRYNAGNLVEDIEYNTRTDSFFSRMDSLEAYRLDSVRYKRIQSGIRTYTYGTQQGFAEAMLPYNLGRSSEQLPVRQTLYRNKSTVSGIWDPLYIGMTEYSYAFTEGLLTEQTRRSTDAAGAVRTWVHRYAYRKKP